MFYKLVSESGHVAMYSSNKPRLEVLQADWAIQWPSRKFTVMEAN